MMISPIALSGLTLGEPIWTKIDFNHIPYVQN